MDLLREDSVLSATGRDFRVYSRPEVCPPQFMGKAAHVRNSLIAEGAVVHGTVVDSVVSGGVTVSAGAEVHHSVIMPNATIAPGARVYYAIVDSGARIAEGEVVGRVDGGKDTITVVGGGGGGYS